MDKKIEMMTIDISKLEPSRLAGTQIYEEQGRKGLLFGNKDCESLFFREFTSVEFYNQFKVEGV